MRNPIRRFPWIVGLVMVGLAAQPAKSFALCDWLCSWLRPRGTAVTTYTPPFSPRPVVAAATPAATVCSYVPQTAYQAVYRPVPVTAYQPITTWDPCTGCATTAYRPVTAWGYQAQLVPTTTYRMVCTAPATTYAPPAVSYGTLPAPVLSSGSVVSPACGACAPSTGVPTLSPTPSPLSTPLPSGTPMTVPGPVPSASAGGGTSGAAGQPASGATGAGGTSGATGAGPSTAPGAGAPASPSGTTPTYAPPPGSTTPPTGPISPSAPGRSGSLFDSPGFRLRVSPGSTMPSSTPVSPPPGTPGRTALRPVIPASFTQEARQTVAAPAIRSHVTGQPLDVGGWQPVR